MFGSLLSLRLAERRPAWIAFAFLTVLVGSHTLLETARDALFLAHLPAGQLPIVYLSIAALSLVVSRTEARLSHLMPQRIAVVFWTGLATVGTAGFWLLLPVTKAMGLYALYVWTGVIAALVLLHFWSLLAEALSVTQAKRLYPLIGSGSVVGALGGSALASLLARAFGAPTLLMAASAGFALSVCLAIWLMRFGFGSAVIAGVAAPVPQADPVLDVQPISAAHSGGPDAKLTRDARLAARDPYVRRVAGMLFASAACLTVLDYLFKSTIAANVPPAQLGMFFGGVSLMLNILSLVCQLLLAPFLLKRFDLRVTLGTLPALLLLAGSGLLFGFGLGAALLGKAADGALRYSLHRTASELLYLPLADRTRPRIKAALDVVGQRAGQALASLLILGLAALAHGNQWLCGLLCALAGSWLLSALDLRRQYVSLLQRQLRVGDSSPAHAFPELDVASLETLVAALDSRNDNEVLAALSLLEREQKARLVPALILHHPSEAVVLRALSLFARERRTHAVHVIDRLLNHASVAVRCDAIAARSLLAPDFALLQRLLETEQAPEVRATITVQLIAAEQGSDAAAAGRLQDLLRTGTATARAALATAISWRNGPAFDTVLVQLAAASEAEVRLAAIVAMSAQPSAQYIAPLIALLERESTRSAARRALLAHGEPGLIAVCLALQDLSLPRALRWELPRTLGLFEPGQALQVLLERLTLEPDGMVRYRIIRTLETLIAKHPRLSLDRAILKRVIGDTVARAYRHLDERLSLERGAATDAQRRTPGYDLLVSVLQAKEKNTTGRLLSLLGLAHPAADFVSIRQSLRSNEPKLRAKSVDLIGNLLEQPLRGAVLGLLEEAPDVQRLAAATPFYRVEQLDYHAVLERMLARESPALQDVTAYHIAELGLSQFQPLIAALAQADPSRSDLRRALSRLGQTGAGEWEFAPC